jgi:hypothetical protein
MHSLLPKGTTYDVQVPATLDLAERATIAINGLTGVLDPKGIHEMYFIVGFGCHPPFMYKDTTGWPTNNPKFAESLPMMRVMSGSDQNLDLERDMMQSMLATIGSDGLYYAIVSPDRPWHEGVGHKYPTTGEDFANTYGNARMLLALMAWYAREPDPTLWNAMGKMAHGLADMAIVKDDYAYYPDGQIGEAFSRPRSGWRDTTEPAVEKMGAEGSMFMYHGGQIRAMTRWYEMSGDKSILDMVSRLVRFVLKPKFWGVEGEQPGLHGAEHGHFFGHYHAHLSLLRGLLEYGRVTHDRHLLDFVRESYEYCRQYGLPQIGWFAPQGWAEGCAIGDMVALSARLADYGLGDYWEDVEQIARNHLVEQQLIDIRRLEEASASGTERPADRTAPMGGFRPHAGTLPGQMISENVFDRSRGIYGGVSKPDTIPEVWTMQCCTGNGTQGLYYAWESITRHTGQDSQINLLLNRASPWLDVDSYLPYEGKVLVHSKTSQRLAVHMPRWVEPADPVVKLDGQSVKTSWVGRYLVVEDLKAGSEVEIEFPVYEQTVAYTLDDRTYQCRFRGNDLIEISHHLPAAGAYPMYVDRAITGEHAPMRTVSRYVAEKTLPW